MTSTIKAPQVELLYDPVAGVWKLRCPHCDYFAATRDDDTYRVERRMAAHLKARHG